MASCINHPDKESSICCLECGTPLCNQCAVHQQADAYLCRKCVTRRVAQETVQGISIRQQDSIERELVYEARRKKNVLLVRMVLLSVVMLIIGVNLYLYFYHSTPLWNEQVSEENPAVTIIIVDAALQDYADDHQGEYPEDLEELQGAYIEPEELASQDLYYIDYTRTSPYTYELRLLDSSGAFASDLVLTEMGSNEIQQ